MRPLVGALLHHFVFFLCPGSAELCALRPTRGAAPDAAISVRAGFGNAKPGGRDIGGKGGGRGGGRGRGRGRGRGEGAKQLPAPAACSAPLPEADEPWPRALRRGLGLGAAALLFAAAPGASSCAAGLTARALVASHRRGFVGVSPRMRSDVCSMLRWSSARSEQQQQQQRAQGGAHGLAAVHIL